MLTLFFLFDLRLLAFVVTTFVVFAVLVLLPCFLLYLLHFGSLVLEPNLVNIESKHR